MEVLQGLSLSGLEAVWAQIARQSVIREKQIKKLHTSLDAVETTRVKKVSLLPNDIHNCG